MSERKLERLLTTVWCYDRDGFEHDVEALLRIGAHDQVSKERRKLILMIPGVNVAALAVLQSNSQLATAKSAGNDVLSLAAGAKSADDLAAKPADQDDLFSVFKVDANKLKIDLFERVGNELGINQDDFDSMQAYGRALESLVNRMKVTDGGLARLTQIEENLGLDKLGISIDTLVGAIAEPGGLDDEKLTQALEDEAAELNEANKLEDLVDLDIYQSK